MFAPCAFKKHAYLLRALQPRGRSRGYFRDVPRNCLSLGRDKAKASRVSSTYFPRTTKEIALPFETFVKTKRIRVAHLPTTTVSAPAMARALLQNPLSLLNARTKNLCSSQGVVQNTIPRRMDRKHKCAVRSEGFHGQPSSRSWDSGEEFLGDLFRDVVKFIFPGSKSTSSQDMILALDAYETLIAYVYYADVPGVPRDSLQVSPTPWWQLVQKHFKDSYRLPGHDGEADLT